jgi:hypothetical protein
MSCNSLNSRSLSVRPASGRSPGGTASAKREKQASTKSGTIEASVMWGALKSAKRENTQQARRAFEHG